MKYKTHNDYDIKTDGTSFKGYLTANYDELVKAFGEPMDIKLLKQDACWDIEFEDGTIATIYNWKNGVNYCGVEGQNVQHIRDWHIGGFSMNAEIEVDKVLKFKRDFYNKYAQCDGECASYHFKEDLYNIPHHLEELKICKTCANNGDF